MADSNASKTSVPDEIVRGVPEFVIPKHDTYRDATHVVRASNRDFEFPVPMIRRDDLHPGDVFQSSHGYALFVTRVKFRVTSNPDQHVWIEGRLHGPNGLTECENYPKYASVPLLSRGGVEFGKTPEVPRVPATQEELDRSYINVDGRTIDRRFV